VKADAVESGTLGGGDEHAPAQAALIRGAAVAPGEDECVLGRLPRAVRVQQGGQLGRQWDLARAMTGLRCDDRALDDRALYVQVRRRAVEHEIAPAQAARLGDPQPGRGQQLEQRPPLDRYLVEQPHELGTCQVAALARRPGPAGAPAREHELPGRVGVQ
jgi:hypothetical protein